MYMCVVINVFLLYHTCIIVKCMLYGYCHYNHHGDGSFISFGWFVSYGTSDH